MPNIWFTSDTHYGHNNILEYCKRPFANIQEHDEALISNFNELVKPDDTVYHIGDFCLGHPKHAANIYRRLNGYIYLIKGNHDRIKNYDGLFVSIEDVKLLKLGKDRARDWIWLSHYAHARWPHAHHGALHLFGHSHGGFKGLGRSMDVGVDTNDYYPYHLEDIQDLLRKSVAVEHHGED